MKPQLLLFVSILFFVVAETAATQETPTSRPLTQRLLAEPIDELVRDAKKFGDPSRGAIAFYRPTMNCAKCHESASRNLAPSLTEKREATTRHMIESVLKPSSVIHDGFQTVRVALNDGRLITGVLVDESDTVLVVDSIEQSDKLTIAKDNIEEWAKSKTSSMPVDLANQLADRQQFLDLISYVSAIVGNPELQTKLKPATAAVAPLPEYESRVDHAALIRSLNAESLERGSEVYRLRCASCHGTVAEEGSMPTSLRFGDRVKGKFKHGSDPLTMYQTLTHGYGMMNPQRWMVPQQKHEVIHYIREHFLKAHNSEQLFDITDDYLASLPKGDTRGPKPVVSRPWTLMDYGHSMMNTIEVSNDGSNIAQKGIVIRLDSGQGGVESGSHWMMYEHDTLRVAGAWSGSFIDWEGIHFNGTHGRHPSVSGDIHFSNPTGPGFARPGADDDSRFEDDRVVGRDGKHYGPLPKNWAQYLGMYRFGNRSIIKYRIGETEILESPSLSFVKTRPVYTRHLNIGKRTDDLEIQIANVTGQIQLVGGKRKISLAYVVESTNQKSGLAAYCSLNNATWSHDNEGNLRLKIKAGDATNLVISHMKVTMQKDIVEAGSQLVHAAAAQNLEPLARGGPANYPERLTTNIIRGDQSGPFAVDVFERPVNNPWNAQLRLTGIDFLPDDSTAIVSAWDGSVWRVTGFLDDESKTLTWQRIAAGLFQPLGVKCVGEKIYIICRDQLVQLHDLNGDHEADWYENFNSDHQVTEHFHEFAMGLQTDDEGNFYYAKSARHAKKAIVPHHGTLLKVSADGKQTEIIANGFRAANGVCINGDGSFVVTDQEGHWNPKNRINWVRPGQFYGNMFGYHDVEDDSDSAMQNPLCWITNEFDRSPGELLWVTSDKWGPLKGSLLNFSYGYGKVYIVPHETVDGNIQGGMCEFPIEQFPTGVMRGRFHATDGQLYCCGMFAWAGSQQKPGGLYRIRYTEKPVHLPIGLNATKSGMSITFSAKVDLTSASDPNNYSIKTWDLKRTENYGSEHYNPKTISVTASELLTDGKTVSLTIPEIQPTWGMEIKYRIKTDSDNWTDGKIHNSIFQLGNQ